MSKGLASYRAAFDALPEAQKQARAEAFERFTAQGFPTREQEDWKYTDLSALDEAAFAPSVSSEAPELTALEGFEALRFINGARIGGDATQLRVDLLDDGVTALNAALARDGLELTVPRNTQAKPLHVIAWSGGGMSHLLHRIRVEAGAEATIFFDLRGADAASLSTAVTRIELGANARLRLIRLQALSAQATDLSRTEVSVGRDATFEYLGLDLGGQLTRHDLNVRLAEPGAEAQVHGVFAPSGRTHQDTHTRIFHAAPHTTSREIFRGLINDQAHAVFNGKIVVEPDAQKTDSEQNIGSLLLSPGAEVNAKPELEIYADDVKCAHGATCGQLDETAIYYLRSRGLDRIAARNLLLYTFAHAALSRLGSGPAQAELQQQLLRKLGKGGELEGLLTSAQP